MRDEGQIRQRLAPDNQEVPIRVLHVVTTMNRGGLESMLMNYYRQMDRSLIQFDFLIHRQQESDFEKEILSLGGRIYRIQPLNPVSSSYKKMLRQFFSDHPYSIVHVHQDCLSSVALFEAEQCHIPVRIAHCHNSNQDRNWKYLIKLLYKKKIQDYATALLSCSKKSGFWMFETADFQVLNNAIDTEKFKFSSSDRSRIRKEFQIPEDSLLIGHVGRFDKVKNHTFLIHLFSEFSKSNSQARLLLVGKGSEEEQIKSEVKELQLQDKVIFTGLRSDVNSLMSAMDCFVMPSVYEGTPMVLVEAQCSGLPCLISDTIPNDCDLTSKIQRCSLTGGFDEWIEALETIELHEREKSYCEIRDRGFDIRENVLWLTDFYLNSLRNSK